MSTQNKFVSNLCKEKNVKVSLYFLERPEPLGEMNLVGAASFIR